MGCVLWQGYSEGALWKERCAYCSLSWAFRRGFLKKLVTECDFEGDWVWYVKTSEKCVLTYGNVNKYKETYNSTIYNQATENRPLLLVCEAHWGSGRKLRLELLHMPCSVFILYATCLQTFFDYTSILVKLYWTVTSNISARIYTFYTCSCLSVYSVQFSCSVMCDSLRPHKPSTPGFPVHHQLPEFTQTHVHRVADAIQPSHPLSSPSPPALNLF